MKLVTYSFRRAVNSVRHRAAIVMIAGVIAVVTGYTDINLLISIVSQVLP